jgi:D-aspartate ligase
LVVVPKPIPRSVQALFFRKEHRRADAQAPLGDKRWPIRNRSRTPERNEQLPPAILLGGDVNALSVARDLSAMGVTVYAVGGAGSSVRHSRHCRWIELLGNSDETTWADFLLGAASEHLRGAVLLPCSDAGIRVVARHRDALLKRFLLDVSDPRAQIEMLDKLTTYEHAAKAGVATPKFWPVASREALIRVRDELVYPLVVKPRLSHVFEQRFGKKHVVANSFDSVATAFHAAIEAHVDVLLVELIPGEDDHLASYFTYVDDGGDALIDFTKRVIRRYPAGIGAACYHITDWVPEIVGPSRALLRQSGLRGLANIEFKRDDRDGKYKLIECNGRFAGSNCLVTAAGCNLAAVVYNRIVGRPHEVPSRFKMGLRLWDPMRDFYAFRERRRTGVLTTMRWLASVCHRQTFPVFRWSDPRPGLARAVRMFRSARQSRLSSSGKAR